MVTAKPRMKPANPWQASFFVHISVKGTIRSPLRPEQTFFQHAIYGMPLAGADVSCPFGTFCYTTHARNAPLGINLPHIVDIDCLNRTNSRTQTTSGTLTSGLRHKPHFPAFSYTGDCPACPALFHRRMKVSPQWHRHIRLASLYRPYPAGRNHSDEQSNALPQPLPQLSPESLHFPPHLPIPPKCPHKPDCHKRISTPPSLHSVYSGKTLRSNVRHAPRIGWHRYNRQRVRIQRHGSKISHGIGQIHKGIFLNLAAFAQQCARKHTGNLFRPARWAERQYRQSSHNTIFSINQSAFRLFLNCKCMHY